MLSCRGGLLWLVLALASCAAPGELRPFGTDGCSLFPDGPVGGAAADGDRRRWCDCCVWHDVAYWRGGTEAERRRADEALRDCVAARTGDTALAQTMYLGVRAGGHPAFPTWYRWGYGWSYGRGYAPLDARERARADALLENVQDPVQLGCAK